MIDSCDIAAFLSKCSLTKCTQQSSQRQQNKAAHIFCNDFGFVRAFPMKKESKAHEALSLLFHRDGVPNVMVMDGATAQTGGQFRSKLRDAG
jgi:hypothetical protein